MKSGKKLFFIRENINRAFQGGAFPYIVEKEPDKESDEKSDESDEIGTTDMPDLESEESTVQRENQQGQELTILTLILMLSRLPISLAQLKAGNNSEKLKNESRQLLYSLYRSKKLTKNIYNCLINAI